MPLFKFLSDKELHASVKKVSQFFFHNFMSDLQNYFTGIIIK